MPGRHRLRPDTGESDEAHVPAECSQASEEARVSQPYVHQGRPRNREESPAQGPTQAGCLIHGISDRATFAAVRRSGIQVRTTDLLLRHLPDPDGEFPRVAFTIPRKVGGAVERNRIRRRLRSILTDRLREGRMPTGATVFIIHPGCATMTYTQLREQVTEVLDALETRIGATPGDRG